MPVTSVRRMNCSIDWRTSVPRLADGFEPAHRSSYCEESSSSVIAARLARTSSTLGQSPASPIASAALEPFDDAGASPPPARGAPRGAS